MKKLLLILLTLSFSYSYADSCHVNARTYVNTYITQNSVRAITGNILNTALNKIISAIYCVDTSATGGVSQSALNDSVTALRLLRKMDSIDISLSASRDSTVFKFFINGTMYRVPIRDSIGVNTDAQTLSVGTNTLTISGGNTVNLNRKADTSYFFRNATLDSLCQITIINGISYRSCGKDSTGGGASLSGLTAATASNTINNVANAQEWQWNSLSSGIGLKLSSSSTAAASNTQTIFQIENSGANATVSQTSYAQKISNAKTGTGSRNIGLRIDITNGSSTKNVGLIINSSGGTAPRSLVVESGGGAVELNGEYLYFLSTDKYIYGNASNLTYSAGDRAHSFSTTNACYAYFASNTNNANPFTINRPATRDYELMFGGVSAGASTWLCAETSVSTIRSLNGALSISSNSGLAGSYAGYTPTYRFTVKTTGAINFTPITATAASAITPAEGDMVFVSDTNGTFTSIGLWCYENAAWSKK